MKPVYYIVYEVYQGKKSERKKTELTLTDIPSIHSHTQIAALEQGYLKDQHPGCTKTEILSALLLRHDP